jgi:hypothetical protein
LAFLVGAHFQIMAKADRNRTCMLEKLEQNRTCMLEKLEQIRVCLLKKIDASVGKVWDAGERAGERRKDLEEPSRPLAAVRDLGPRR